MSCEGPEAEPISKRSAFIMDQPLDFSFHKGNPLAVTDDIESPKPMPKPPVLPLTDSPDGNLEDQLPASKESDASTLNNSMEVVETLSIAPTAVAATVPVAHPIINLPEASTSTTQEASLPPPKPKPRGKVPLERGFTQMSWLKLTRTQPDLAGLRGRSNKRLVPMEEVEQHQSEDDVWTVLRGRVYNVSPYLKFHPGGIDMLMEGAGKDCTALFNNYHSWVNAEFLLEKCLVGHLDFSFPKDHAQGKSS